jgi:hypothetical protein
MKNYTQYLMKDIGVSNIYLKNHPEENNIQLNKHDIPYHKVNNLHKLCMECLDEEHTIETLKELVLYGVKLNQYINEFGFNLLFFVKNKTVIKFLIQHKVNPNHFSNSDKEKYCDCATPGTTALHYACYYHWYEVIETLINNGADINLIDKDNVSPLGYAILDLDHYIDKEVKKENNKQKVLDKLVPAFKSLSLLINNDANAVYFQSYNNKQIEKLLTKVHETIRLFM